MQWRSQDTADARAQHGHTTFVQCKTQMKLEGSGGKLPLKILEVLNFLGQV